jgi:multiple sugar transport system permease protein
MNRIMRKQAYYNMIAGLLFILPMLVLTITLVIIPILLSVVISFTNWNFIAGIGGLDFIGFDNYDRLIRDETFHRSLLNNVIIILVVPISMFLSLVLATLINNHII